MPPKYQSAVVFVADMAASRHFYEELMEQRVLMDLGENVAFEGGFVIHSIAHIYSLALDRDLVPSERVESERFELYFEYDELEALKTRLDKAGAEFVHGIVEQPWAQRVFRVRDPDGHLVEVGESLEALVTRLLAQGMSPLQVSDRTSLPIEVVQQMMSLES